MARIVEPPARVDARAVLEVELVGEDVAQLPLRVVVRHPQKRPALAVGRDDAEVRGLAAQMHVGMQRDQLHVGAQGGRGVDLVVRRAGRDLEARVDDGEAAHHLGRPLLGEDEADLGAVLRRLAVGRVVHLQHEVGARFHVHGASGLVLDRRLAGRVGAKRACAHRQPRRIDHLAALGPESARRRLAQPRTARRAQHCRRVMHHRAVARPHLEGLHPFVLGETKWQDDELVFDHAVRRHLELVGQLDHQVGFADLPAVSEDARRRPVLGIAWRRAGVDPGHDPGDLVGRQGAVVGEVVDAGIGVPRRHLADGERFGDAAR